VTWKKIKRSEFDKWNKRLSKIDAHLFQYPMWNEPFRKMYFKPLYLVLEEETGVRLYVAILSLGFFPYRVGLIQRGPVVLAGNGVKEDDFKALREWLRARGFIFVRFTGRNREMLSVIKSMNLTSEEEPFPFYRDMREELVIHNNDNIDNLFNNFPKKCRYKIRRARKSGYVVKHTTSVDELEAIWPLFQKVAMVKGFKRRPLKSFVVLFNYAHTIGFVRLFSVYHNKNLVAARIMIRDKNSAYSLSSALDRDALFKNISPGLLLHWESMQYFFSNSIKLYNFGSRSGSVYEFKNSFHPEELVNPLPVVMIINNLLYRSWKNLVLNYFYKMFFRIKKLIR